MATRDVLIHPYYAGHGHACMRVDLRGSGESDGVLEDEHAPQEQEDLLEVIAWIARRPWCSGGVGMTGISWTGFNSLQVAARRPPALKAIVTLMSTDDRYADDVHYKGGCVSGLDMFPWGASMLHYDALPPHPQVVGDEGWRERWNERLEANFNWAETWLAHQRRVDYWRQGSVCEDYAAIEAAVYAIGGWTDGYTNAVLRLMAGLPGPRKGLIGPWSHSWPNNSIPGPSIGFLQDTLRWWDHWLKGVDTGIMDEPMLRVWMEDFVEPAPVIEQHPGRWVAEEAWPSPRIMPATWHLNAGTLDDAPAPETRIDHRSLMFTGIDAGAWCMEGSPGDWPFDQRAEDGRSVVWDSQPLAEPIAILGFLFRDQIETVARDLRLIAAMMIVVGVVLFVADRVGRRAKTLADLGARDGVVFGLAQTCALIPGVSRSGGTISAGLFLGYTRPAATRYAFLLAVPAVLASGLFEALKIGGTSATAWGPTLLATVIAFAVGYAVIAWLIRYVATNSFLPFVIYRIGVGVLVFVLLGTGTITA